MTDITQTTIKQLDAWGTEAFSNQESFLDRFCHGAWMLTSATWDSENMKVVYILESGQHITDSFKMQEWLEWYTNQTATPDR